MINQNLHLKPSALDRDEHRALKLRLPLTDWRVAHRLNAMFVAAVEFGDVCREYPIVFVRAGKDPDGSEQIASVAVLGLVDGQNLYVDEGPWRAQYIPAVLRSYPFCIGRIDESKFAICVDMAWPGANNDDGEPLFQPDGQPTEMLKGMQQHLETLEGEIQRTRAVGKRLLDLDLLRDMRFDATLPDGRQHTVDGFLTVDEEKARALPDAVIGELHRSGLLALIHAHWVSLGNMRQLVDWHAKRQPATVAPIAPPAA